MGADNPEAKQGSENEFDRQPPGDLDRSASFAFIASIRVDLCNWQSISSEFIQLIRTSDLYRTESPDWLTENRRR